MPSNPPPQIYLSLRSQASPHLQVSYHWHRVRVHPSNRGKIVRRDGLQVDSFICSFPFSFVGDNPSFERVICCENTLHLRLFLHAMDEWIFAVYCGQSRPRLGSRARCGDAPLLGLDCLGCLACLGDMQRPFGLRLSVGSILSSPFLRCVTPHGWLMSGSARVAEDGVGQLVQRAKRTDLLLACESAQWNDLRTKRTSGILKRTRFCVRSVQRTLAWNCAAYLLVFSDVCWCFTKL